MKKVVLYLAAISFAGVIGGATAYLVAQTALQSGAQPTVVVNHEPRTPQMGTQFASYVKSEFPDLTYAAENAVHAVVNIEAIQKVETRSRGSYDPFYQFFGFPQQGGGSQPQIQERRSGGSGVIISEDGYIVTNNHVVESASQLKVKLYDGRIFEAKVIGTDPTTDIALIKIEEAELPTIPFGSSDELRLGEWVLAIGSPFDLQSTITAGIVSAKARQLDVIPSEFRIESFIQTDAAVNPGNSGGALVNTHGELVGINTVIKSQTGSYIGYSFAVPESIVKKVVMDLKEFGVVQRALLGISFRAVDQQFIDSEGKDLGIDKLGGVYVASVQEDGAASTAGVRKGDIITSINGVELNDKSSLQEQVGKHRPGDQIKIVVKRGKEVKHFDVTLRNRSGKEELLAQDSVDVIEALGGKFSNASDKLCRELEINGGVVVNSVDNGGLLARARVKRGFVITHINDKPIYALSDLERLVDNVKSIDGIYTSGRAASYMFVE
ncbi:MAG: Do family serine endopeptidase [Rikenellaceae bacterium]